MSGKSFSRMPNQSLFFLAQYVIIYVKQSYKFVHYLEINLDTQREICPILLVSFTGRVGTVIIGNCCANCCARVSLRLLNTKNYWLYVSPFTCSRERSSDLHCSDNRQQTEWLLPTFITSTATEWQMMEGNMYNINHILYCGVLQLHSRK